MKRLNTIVMHNDDGSFLTPPGVATRALCILAEMCHLFSLKCATP